MKVSLLGATGLVGSEVLSLLLQIPEVQVIRVLTRKKQNFPDKVESFVQESFELNSVPTFFDSDVLICCLGSTIKKAGSKDAFWKFDHDLPFEAGRIFREKNGKHFILVSALGANPQSLFFYNRVKGTLEKDLQSLHFPILDIIRPSLLLGERTESRPGEKFGQILSPLFNILLMGPLKKYRAVSAKLVGKLASERLLNRETNTDIENIRISGSAAP